MLLWEGMAGAVVQLGAGDTVAWARRAPGSGTEPGLGGQ